MVGGISRIGSYYSYYNPYAGRLGRPNAAAAVGSANKNVPAAETAASPPSQGTGVGNKPGYPSVPAPTDGQAKEIPDLFIRKGADPAEYAVKMRMQYIDTGSPEASRAVRGRGGVRKTANDGKCQTCEQRKYKDGSNDMGVSFKTPTRVSPESAAAAVRGHEQQHVSREQAKAARENRRVVSQSVTLQTSVCPECGRVYISGGTTRTTTVSKPQPEETQKNTKTG